MCVKVGLAILIALKTWRLDDILQHATHVLVNILHIQATSLHGLNDVVSLSRITWRHEVVASLHLHFCGQIMTLTYPVSHHNALVAPVVAQNGSQEVFVTLGIESVHLIIRRHDGPWVALAYHNLKAFQVELAKGTLRHALIDLGTGVLLGVDGKVLS